MRRQGQYSDSGVNAYIASQMQNMPGQRMERKSGHFQGRSEALTSEEEHPYSTLKAEGQWRWERDASNVSNSMSSHMFNEGEGAEARRSFYQGQRLDPKMSLEKQANNEEDMDIGYEENPTSQSFESLEQRFLDDIMKLTKDQSDAEDAENARHRDKINAINAQYQEQLASLRARHSNRRDEFLKKESHARQEQYQQAMMGPSDSHSYGRVTSSNPVGEERRGYNDDQYDSYRERARFLGGGGRDHGFEPRGGPYPGGRVYDTGPRYY